MRSTDIKLRNLPKTSVFFSTAFLLLFWAVSAERARAQDIPNTEAIKAVTAASPKKKAVNAVKPKEVKPKFTAAVSLKNNSPVVKEKARPKVSNKETTPEKAAIIPISENVSKSDAIAAVSGTVRLKQLNQAAAGVLIEAIRVDTREMIGSAETNGAGEFKLNKLPANVDLVFLVSSSNTKPLIFKTSVGSGMKNLDFAVFPK